MPIDSTHPSYDLQHPLWTKTRDVVDGEETVKDKGEQYLPRLSDQDDSEYKAYKLRAMFYGATGRTVQGLAGMIMRKDPRLEEFPDAHVELLDRIGHDEESLMLMAEQAAQDLVGVGRLGLLVDMESLPVDEDGQVVGNGNELEPYLVKYWAENVINWHYAVVNGRRILDLVVLKEEVEEIDPEDPAGLAVVVAEQWRLLILDNPGMEAGVTPEGVQLGASYRQEVWRKKTVDQDGTKRTEWEKTEDVFPAKRGGLPMTEIPFSFVNAHGVSAKTEKPPIIDLVNVNVSHYRNSADLEHGRHFTALPTAWVAGFNEKTRLQIGSSVAWVTEKENAKAGFLEFTGAGLGHLANGMESKEKLMAVLGARLLEEQKRQAEAAETVKLRHTGEKSVLASISTSLSEALTKCLRWILEFLGEEPHDDLVMELNKDFEASSIDPQLMLALLQAVQSGDMSWDTFFHNVQKGELYPEGRTADEEKQLIESGRPEPPLGVRVGDDEEDDEDAEGNTDADADDDEENA